MVYDSLTPGIRDGPCVLRRRVMFESLFLEHPHNQFEFCWICEIGRVVFCFAGALELHLAVLRGCSWLSAQGSLLWYSGNHMQFCKLRPATCKTSALTPEPSFLAPGSMKC